MHLKVVAASGRFSYFRLNEDLFYKAAMKEHNFELQIT